MDKCVGARRPRRNIIAALRSALWISPEKLPAILASAKTIFISDVASFHIRKGEHTCLNLTEPLGNFWKVYNKSISLFENFNTVVLGTSTWRRHESPDSSRYNPSILPLLAPKRCNAETN